MFNARLQLPSGPPLVTTPRDVEATVASWADRRAVRAEEARMPAEQKAKALEEATHRSRRRRFRRRRNPTQHST